jgi:imidazolonepropionase-like amidohydrolase
MYIRALVLAIVWSSLLPCAVEAQQRQPRAPQSLVIQGATLIDGTGAAPIRNATIVIQGSKIQSILSGSSPVATEGATVINAQGKFIVPGLFDAHVHWRGWTGELFLAHGITTVIDLGDKADWILGARGAEENGQMRGPRIFTTGNIIDARSDSTGFSFTDAGSGYSPVSYVGSAAEAAALTRELMEKGVDAIKVYQHLTGDELNAVTTEAHKVGLTVIGHSDDLYDSVNHGVDGITHLWGVAETLMSHEDLAAFHNSRIACPYAHMQMNKMDALVSFLVQHGTYINPCLINEHAALLQETKQFEMDDYHLLMDDPNLRYVPLTATLSSLSFFHELRSYSAVLGSFPFAESVDPSVLDEFHRGYEESLEFVRRFSRAGGKIFAGTDTAGSASLPGASLVQELQLLVDAGLTPMQAIQSATQVPAQLIHVDYKLGTLQPGRLADLLILDADPLADIRNIEKIDKVVKNGSVVDTSYHRDYQPAFSELEGVGISSSTAGVPKISEVTTVTLNQNSQALHGGSPFELVVKGQTFRSSSLVFLDGRPLKTQFISARELHADVPTDRTLEPGTSPITVFTPWPGGGTSNVSTLTLK